MAVVTVKSAQITNRDATPKVLNNPAITNSRAKKIISKVTVTSGNSIGSVYIFGSIPSNAVVSQLLIYSDDLGTTTIADFGLYDTTANGGVVVDADFFASAVSLKDGALNGSDITHEAAGAFPIASAEMPLWQALGLTSDPCKMYDLAATLTAACDGTGSVVAKCEFAEG